MDFGPSKIATVVALGIGYAIGVVRAAYLRKVESDLEKDADIIIREPSCGAIYKAHTSVQKKKPDIKDAPSLVLLYYPDRETQRIETMDVTHYWEPNQFRVIGKKSSVVPTDTPLHVMITPSVSSEYAKPYPNMGTFGCNASNQELLKEPIQPIQQQSVVNIIQKSDQIPPIDFSLYQKYLQTVKKTDALIEEEQIRGLAHAEELRRILAEAEQKLLQNKKSLKQRSMCEQYLQSTQIQWGQASLETCTTVEKDSDVRHLVGEVLTFAPLAKLYSIDQKNVQPVEELPQTTDSVPVILAKMKDLETTSGSS